MPFSVHRRQIRTLASAGTTLDGGGGGCCGGGGGGGAPRTGLSSDGSGGCRCAAGTWAGRGRHASPWRPWCSAPSSPPWRCASDAPRDTCMCTHAHTHNHHTHRRAPPSRVVAESRRLANHRARLSSPRASGSPRACTGGLIRVTYSGHGSGSRIQVTDPGHRSGSREPAVLGLADDSPFPQRWLTAAESVDIYI